MNYTVVFELSNVSKIHYYGSVGVFSGLFIIAISIFVSSFGTASYVRIWAPILSALFSVVFLYFSIQLSISTTRMINYIYGNYSNNTVEIAEGFVENCDTEFFYQNGHGSFEVQGVIFDYGHTTGIPGYRGKGNLIHTNGQKVKIHYVSYSDQNIIVKIELPADGT